MVGQNPGPKRLVLEAKTLITGGARIIPIGYDKRPLFRWAKYQTQEPTEDEIRDWCLDSRTAGWAVLTGPVSGGWQGIDVEAAGMGYPQILDPLKNLPRTCLRKSQHGGAHAHVRIYDAPDDYDWGGEALAQVKSASTGLPVLLAEFRGAGQYIVVTGPGRPPLPDDFAPHPVSVETFRGLIEPARALNDPSVAQHKAVRAASAAAGKAHAAKRVKGDTGDVLRQAVLEQPDIWPLLLDPGWSILGVYPRWWQNPEGTDETRVTLLRPGKQAGDGESGNGLGPVLFVFSTSVPWWPVGCRGLSPMQAVAEAWFDGDYKVATAAAELAAKNLVESGVAPDPASAFHAWPSGLLEDVHAARVKQHAEWVATTATAGMTAPPVAEGAIPEEAGPGATVTAIKDHAARTQANLANVETKAQDDENKRALRMLRGRIYAEGVKADEDAAAMRALRVRRTASEYAAQPPIEAVMDKILAVECNLLGGPSEAGKSLVARDWCLSVASGQPWRGHSVKKAQDVIWVASEGLHDFGFRWSGQPLWSQAKDRVHVYDVPVSLLSKGDIDAFIASNADLSVGLVVFDIIYGMGMPDDNGTKDVGPVIDALKRISREMHAATLALGHPGHNNERRFRGASSWRQQATTEYHMAGGSFTCEKSKLTEKATLTANYLVDYPDVSWLTQPQAVAGQAAREQAILDDFMRFPMDSDRQRSDRLSPVFSRKPETVRGWIIDMRKAGSLPK